MIALFVHPLLWSGLDLARKRTDQVQESRVVQQLARGCPQLCRIHEQVFRIRSALMDGLLSIAGRSWTDLLFFHSPAKGL